MSLDGASIRAHQDWGFYVLCWRIFCDEWVTKAMYHYRWVYDAETASYGIGTAVCPTSPDAASNLATLVRERQVSRLAMVGSNRTTGAVIEQSFVRMLERVAAHLDAGFPFLFGSRPSAADFALYGQLHPMTLIDPSVSAKVFSASRRVWFWVHSMRDLSGLSLQDDAGGWLLQEGSLEAIPPTLRALLVEVGRLYVPFMLANAEAVASGRKEVRATLDAGTVQWEQPSFKYQAKCLAWLREHYGKLSSEDRAWVDGALSGTGCSMLVDAPMSHL